MNISSSFINEEKLVERILQALKNSEISLPLQQTESMIDTLVSEETKNTINSLF